MRRCASIAFAAAAVLVAAGGAVHAAQQSTPPSAPRRSTAADPAIPKAFVDQYCVTCHNERNKSRVSNFVLDTVDVSTVAQHPQIWEKVLRKMRGGLMPPAGARRPDRPVYDKFVSDLETIMDRAAAAAPDPGRTETFHRLNRFEYRNVIRDLLALDVDVEELLPADEAGGGTANFDNIAGALRLNQSLLETYLSVAQKVVRTAIGGAPPSAAQVFKVNSDLRQDTYFDGMPLGTRGGIRFDYTFPVDAEYEVKIDLAGNGKDRLELSFDGEPVKVFQIGPSSGGGDYDGMGGSSGSLQVRLPVKAGPREVIATFAKTTAAVEVAADREPFLGGRGPLVAVDSVTITGPFNPRGASDTPSRNRIFICHPSGSSGERECAAKILTTLARRAYRRPLTAADSERLMKFYAEGRTDGDFESGIHAALRAILVSPSFLLRIETDPRNTPPNSVYRISDVELASRLSFFLWSSIPDDELLDVAVKGRLKDPVVLERQTRRMLADPRAEAFTKSFATQWLYLRNVKDHTPIAAFFPNFDESLRLAFIKETELFFDSVRHEDRSVLDLLDADYTFVNERLAQHYGMAGISGADFRRVTLPADSPRRGLLGKGSILLVTSMPQRTSPVLRGKWILENILGTPPPPPPPNVPALGEQKQNDGKVLSVRELLTKHRANPVCSACHSMLDPIGFSLEQFDPIGRFRVVDNGFNPIDSSGVFPDGTKFDGVAQFRATLVSQPQRFVNTVTDKLLIYALGRGLDYYDGPTVRRIVRDAARSNYKFSALVLGIVKSPPFLMRKTASGAPDSLAASR